jgi:hypothetical protein
MTAPRIRRVPGRELEPAERDGRNATGGTRRAERDGRNATGGTRRAERDGRNATGGTRQAVGPRASDGLCCAIVSDSLSAFIEVHVLRLRCTLEAPTILHDASRDRVRTCARGTSAA